MTLPTIFTSYYANKRIKDYNRYGISNICKVENDFYLASPGVDLYNRYRSGSIDEAEYEKIYLRLINISEDGILSYINCYVKHPAVFLCYEKLPKFCHRHIFAKWLRDRGFTVEELEYK